MTRNPLISVIVPVYNVEKYLKQCIESIINQSYTNLQIILVDDGATDSSGAICDAYAEKDARIIVIHKKNGGVSSARNAGLDAATGDFIGFVDSDDYIDKDMYQSMLEALLKNDADMVKCGYEEFSDSKINVVTFKKNEVLEGQLFDYYFKNAIWLYLWNSLMKRELCEGLRCPVGLINEDNYYGGMLLFRTRRLVVLKNTYYKYRWTDTGITKSFNGKRPWDIVLIKLLLKKDLQAFGYKSTKLDGEIARVVYHCITRPHISYKVIKIQKSFLEYLCSNMNLKRRISFWFQLHKKHVETY